MNREIKFRKWHKGLCDMTYWDGLEGSNNLFWHTLTEYRDMYVLQQFTGFEDRNGIEIFEGDILKHDRYQTVGVMEWDKSGSWSRFYPLSSFEVIGNIYENPKLLTK